MVLSLSLSLSPIYCTLFYLYVCNLIQFINFVEVRWEWPFSVSSKEIFEQYLFATYSTSFFFVRDLE